MNYDALKKRVEELVNNQFPLALWNAVYKQHKKHGFKSYCQCFYCQEKRWISNAPEWWRFKDYYRRKLRSAEEKE